jgi:zinc protease
MSLKLKFLALPLLFLFLGNCCFGQNVLPLDPEVKSGVLPNGIKYFIRKNAKPEKRAELRIAINTGSNNENDDQQGLAHFTEHNLFKGTAKKTSLQVLYSIDSVGGELNAYTAK